VQRRRRPGPPVGDSHADSVAVRYLHPDLQVSTEYAATQGRRTAADVLAQRKLFLVLDLDHTLLNSCKMTDLDDAAQAQLRVIVERQQLREEQAKTATTRAAGAAVAGESESANTCSVLASSRTRIILAAPYSAHVVQWARYR
jgi:hypothetical protein